MYALECAAAHVSRSRGTGHDQHVCSRHGPGPFQRALDARRLEVVADGLTLWRGAQVAIDTTLVSPLRRDGSARHRAANIDGAALVAARLRKERTYPELCGEGGRARLVVLAAEVGGRWRVETAQFITALANALSESEPSILRGGMAAAWTRRWSAMLACSAAREFALSLLDRRPKKKTASSRFHSVLLNPRLNDAQCFCDTQSLPVLLFPFRLLLWRFAQGNDNLPFPFGFSFRFSWI